MRDGDRQKFRQTDRQTKLAVWCLWFLRLVSFLGCGILVVVIIVTVIIVIVTNVTFAWTSVPRALWHKLFVVWSTAAI